ncbi:MAG: DNA polymerase III subunit gamma/tau [Flavobacteriales bacterium]|nr:DNA polymerase III subunit gamma/tau [Flavobacteriales bacterium]
MEDFIVSARKYRPQTFDSVVGQENVTETLLKAIEQNHLAQAFLFSGPRGVGKTTCARILAKTVNQYNKDVSDENQDYSFNIFELDAASNNSVDDIRNLIDQVRIPPQVGKYKVYIIDEVHMLSSSAFNAFLKTLEEPPPYAIFIMATTEKHKVLPTILSRCQVFDFNRIQIPEMVAHLRDIAEREGVDAGDDALHIIAEKADGALRDALSIFDQMVSFAGNKITYEDVIKNLNILDYDYYFKLTDTFLNGDKTEALLTLNDILEHGFDSHNFVNGLASHFRNLLFSTSQRTAAIMEVGANIRSKYVEQSKRCDPSFTLNALNILSEVDVNFKTSKNQRLLVEIALLKLCTLTGKISEKKNGSDVVSETRENTDKPPEPKPAEAPVQQPREKSKKQPDEPRQNRSENSNAPEVKAASDSGSKDEASELKEPSHRANEYQSKDSNPILTAEESGNADTEGHFENANKAAEDAEPGSEKPDENASLREDRATPPKESHKEEPIADGSKVDSHSAAPAKKRSLMESKLGKLKTKGMPSLADMNSASAAETNTEAEKQENVDDEAILNANKPANEFNQADLWKVWDEYAAIVKERDLQSYYATLTKHKAILKDQFRVELLIDNHIQKTDLDEDRVNLLAFLREKLQNWRITLEGIVDEEIKNDGDSLYDPQKKFEAMVESNPTLAKMKQMFDLDVDYD